MLALCYNPGYNINKLVRQLSKSLPQHNGKLERMVEMISETPKAQPKGLSADFWKFWTGQTISNLGSSFTGFALPLLVYKLTGSALNLAITSVSVFLPYLLFGLIIGAWADRLDRKKTMIIADIVRAGLIASLPLLALFGTLPIWWIYVMGFVNSTVSIVFDSCEFAAITSLVNQDDLVTANGRIEASYSAAGILGPLLAGALVAVLPIYDVMFADAASFLVSSVSLALVTVSFNSRREKKTTSIRHDMAEGLRYVIGHPVLRNISLMMAMVNFVSSTVGAQFVLFAKQQLSANDWQWGLLSSAGSIGVIVMSLSAGPLRKRFPFSKVALSALTIEGLTIFVLSFVREYWVALPLWALSSGLGILFNINTSSLRQAIVPNDMLGRVRSISGVLAWSAIPVGTFIGGVIIETTGNIALVYAVIGLLNAAIPVAFSLTALGHAEDYLPQSLKPADAQKIVSEQEAEAREPGATTLEAADAGQRLGEAANQVAEAGSR